jgi:acetone carboxylase gamma subunit
MTTGTKEVSAASTGESSQVQSIGDAYTVRTENGDRNIACARCGHDFGDIHEDPKLAAVVAERPTTASSELNAYGSDEFVLREYYCPDCGSMLCVNVQRQGDPVLVEMRLA